MNAKPVKKAIAKLGLGIFRLVMILPTIAVILTLLLLVVLMFFWWNGMALLGLLGGRRGMFWVGRYLGCYPFIYVLLSLLLCAAYFRWLTYGFKVKTTYQDLCADCLDKLEDIEELRDIGGLWGE